MRYQRQSGFTLIEAAVAIAVVAILSGIIVPLVVKNLSDSQVARAKNDIQVIAGAIGSQIKDTGTRPTTAAGPGASTGATADCIWYSGPALTAVPLSLTAATFVAANTFTNLFTTAAATSTAQVLFGYPSTKASTDEFAYKGPYMSGTDAAKTSPWGSPYIILGYNVTQQTASGPIYIVSAGPDGALSTAFTGSATPPATFTPSDVGIDDIVIRAN